LGGVEEKFELPRVSQSWLCDALVACTGVGVLGDGAVGENAEQIYDDWDNDRRRWRRSAVL